MQVLHDKARVPRDAERPLPAVGFGGCRCGAVATNTRAPGAFRHHGIDLRFRVKYPWREPWAGMPHVRFRAGGTR